MKRVTWDDMRIGDIGLAAVPGSLHNGIWQAECALHAGAPTDFQVTHVLIRGPVAGYVTEAWMDGQVNSVAAVNPDSKYTVAARNRQIECWRPEGPESVHAEIFPEFLKKYVPEAYGWPDLIGFETKALFKEIFGVNISNPIFDRLVCSMAAGAYLTMLCDEGCIPELAWTHGIVMKDFDPLAARIAMLGNS